MSLKKIITQTKFNMKESRPKKIVITTKIAVHPIQAKLAMAMKSGDIDLDRDTLRDMCKKIGIKDSPQIIKHHLEQLLKLGILQKVYGQYVYYK